MSHQKQLLRRFSAIATLTSLSMLMLVLPVAVAFAADNTATGNIAGIDADLNDSNTITLTTTTLALVKAAFLADGTPVTTGSSLAKGTVVKFLIYIDNSTAAQVDSVNVSDTLAAAFGYQAGTIKVDSSVNTGANAATIFTAVNGSGTSITDAVSGVDVGGITGATISAGTTGGNAMLSIPIGKVWAMLYTVKMQ